MAETYCGKSCAECDQKEMLQCPGCKVSAGGKDCVECELAGCCSQKGHETCATCTANGNCGLLRSRYRMPEFRRKKQVAEAEYKEEIAQRAPFFGKWLWVLFWAFLMAEFAAFLSWDAFASVRFLSVTAQVIGVLAAVARTWTLVVMGNEEGAYRRAAVFVLLGYVLEHIDTYSRSAFSEVGFGIHVTFLAATISFLGHYNTYLGHINVLSGINNDLADCWSILFKCHIGLICVVVVGILLLFVSLPLSAVVTMIASIGILVIGVINLVFLFQTAKACRDYE